MDSNRDIGDAGTRKGAPRASPTSGGAASPAGQGGADTASRSPAAAAAGPDVVAQLEARIAHLEQEITTREEFISAIGHELRNPLAPVLLHLQRIEHFNAQAPDRKVPAEWLEAQLKSFGKRLTKFLSVLDRVLDASRIEAGRLDLVLESVDLAEIARDVVAGLERELTAARSPVRLHAAEPVIGHWDRLRLEQIVNNLMSNAIRYGAGSEIEVRVCAEGDRAVLCVSDGGVGIAAEDQTRIFERFVRAGAAHRRGGFGIGLWIVKEICQALGGTVRVESRLGQGSRFSVMLPRSPGSLA